MGMSNAAPSNLPWKSHTPRSFITQLVLYQLCYLCTGVIIPVVYCHCLSNVDNTSTCNIHALQTSYKTGMPVRVVRGLKSGTTLKYVYDGLYRVKKYKMVPSGQGPLVIKFLMEVRRRRRPWPTPRFRPLPHSRLQLCMRVRWR